MATQAVIVQFVHLKKSNATSEFRLCSLGNPVRISKDFFMSYSDASRHKSEEFEVVTLQIGAKPWSNFQEPETLEVGASTVIIRAVVWSSAKIAEDSIQPPKPFWVIALASGQVLAMDSSYDEVFDAFRKAVGSTL